MHSLADLFSRKPKLKWSLENSIIGMELNNIIFWSIRSRIVKIPNARLPVLRNFGIHCLITVSATQFFLKLFI